MTLRSLKVPRRFYLKANQMWWAYAIAERFRLNPHEVKEWGADEVLETLAYLDLVQPKGGED